MFPLIRTFTDLSTDLVVIMLIGCIVKIISGTSRGYRYKLILVSSPQVNVTIWDVNDNAPFFESPSLQISIPENVEVETPTYVAHARDADSGRNGAVRYTLTENPGDAFALGSQTGSLVVRRTLDYEARHRYRLVLTATDGGTPPLSSNMSLLVEVQDVNDNAPMFQRPQYYVNVLESLPANSQFLQVGDDFEEYIVSQGTSLMGKR